MSIGAGEQRLEIRLIDGKDDNNNMKEETNRITCTLLMNYIDKLKRFKEQRT